MRELTNTLSNCDLKELLEIELALGLSWFSSVCYHFRYMWE
jgi:hypothetical protein